MKVTFLGTGGWFGNDVRRTSSVLVETARAQFVFDAGSGFPRLWEHLGKKPVFLLLSHYHIDHLAGLFSRAGMNLPGKLTIVGQPGVGKVVGAFFSQPYSPRKPEYRFIEMRHGQKLSLAGATVTAAELKHTSPCIGYRLEAEGKVFTYCTDTQATLNAMKLAKGAGLLVHDSSYLERERPGLPKNLNGHSTAFEAARTAKVGGVKRLGLFHINPGYGYKEEKEVEKEARAAFAKCFVARDGLVVSV